LPEPTYEELQAEITSLRQQLAQPRAPAYPIPPVAPVVAQPVQPPIIGQPITQPVSVQPATGHPRVSPAAGIRTTEPFGRTVRPHAEPFDTPGHHTTITETPEQTTIKTVNVPPDQLPQRLAVPQGLVRRIGKSATPEEILEQIKGLKTIIISGVDSAGYGDKRTEFRSLAELRQILSGLEEELEDLLGRGGRMRQIRMTTAWDKGL
jgi:hypothetical protein